MQFALTLATLEEQSILSNLLELYQYDFTEFSGEEIGDNGRFGTDFLPRYWTEERRWPFLLRVDGKPAGCALVRRAAGLDGVDCYDMVEFFVMRKYRRSRVGETMARDLFDRLRGRWQVREMAANKPAHAFWRAIIGRYTGGTYVERTWDDEAWRGPVQFFDSAPL